MTTDIPHEHASSWFHYFQAVCTVNGWFAGGSSELRPGDNSGTTTVLDVNGAKVVEFQWFKKREGPLSIVFEIENGTILGVNATNDLLDEVSKRNRERAGSKFHVQSYLQMRGPRLSGEFWPDSDTRLRAIEAPVGAAILSEQVIEVDCMAFGADAMHAGVLFPLQLRELAVFLSAVCNIYLRQPEGGEMWVFKADWSGSELRQRGYLDPNRSQVMPVRDVNSAAATIDVQRPWFWNPRSDPDGTKFFLPKDAVELWGELQALASGHHKQFLQAATKLYESKFVAPSSPTLSFSLLLAAIEALKPNDKMYDSANAMFVVKNLLGGPIVARLKDGFLSADIHGTDEILQIRHDNIHRGIFWGREWETWEFVAAFEDPTFQQAHRYLAEVAREALIAWLKNPTLLECYEPPKTKRRKRSGGKLTNPMEKA